MGLGPGPGDGALRDQGHTAGSVWTFASDDPVLDRLWTWAVVRPDAGSVRVALRLGLPGVQPGQQRLELTDLCLTQ
jgi:hypothetical protein